MEALSEAVGGIVTKQAISKYEKGIMIPSSKILIAFSKALNTSVDYFYRPIMAGVQDLEISFRKKSNIGAKEMTALKVEIKDDIEKFLEIEDILGIQDKCPTYHIDTQEILSTKEQMFACAIKVRNDWRLGDAPITNIQDLLESKGIRVLFCEGKNGFDGVSGVVNDNSYIMVLNSDIKMSERLRFTALHELGHLLFNDHFASDLSEYEKEKMCNAFASEFLLPSSVLKEKFMGKGAIYLTELRVLQQLYGISIDAIVYKLFQINIMNEKRYRNFVIRKNQSHDLKLTIEQTRFKEVKTSRFESMVYRALASELISESKAASLLCVTINDLHQNTIAI